MEETVFERLRRARKSLGFTQDQVAEATKISRTSISKIEKGTMEVPTELLLFYTSTNTISSDWLLNGRYPVFRVDEALLTEEEKELNQRIVEVYEVFGYINQKSGDFAFSELMGVSKADWGRIIRNEMPIPAHSLVKIAKVHGLSMDWLLTGKGSINEHRPENKGQIYPKGGKPTPSPLKDEDRPKYGKGGGVPAVVTVDSQGRDNVALVRARARAGYRTGLNDPEFISNLQTYRLPGVDHGTFRMFEVEGNSMYPTLKNKDMVIAEWVESPDQMRDERIYIIVTNDNREEGVIIKRCINRLGNPSMGYILAKSDAASKLEYDPIEIRREEIQEIWYARWYMSTQFTAPSDLYNRMTNLEIEMHQLKTLLIS